MPKHRCGRRVMYALYGIGLCGFYRGLHSLIAFRLRRVAGIGTAFRPAYSPCSVTPKASSELFDELAFAARDDHLPNFGQEVGMIA